MPNILIKVPTGAFNQPQRQQLLRSVSDVAMLNEHMGDAPQQRALCWVLIEEIQADEWLCGGVAPHARAVPCIVIVKVPAGVLDAPMHRCASATYVNCIAQYSRAWQRRISASC